MVLLDSNKYKPLVKQKFDLPDTPSIAVLPFTNMSGDPSQEYFSDGLTEQIIKGRVQRAENRVRITAQLIDALTDFHLWSEN